MLSNFCLQICSLFWFIIIKLFSRILRAIKVGLSNKERSGISLPSENGIIFSLPLEATVSRSFGEMIEVKKTDEEQIIMTRRGVDLQAPVGSVVKCAAEGQVQEVGSNSEDGNYIVVAHANGLKTKYANLDPEVWTGFYINIGLDRLVMMRYGIDDVRLFHSGDLRFLREFK